MTHTFSFLALAALACAASPSTADTAPKPRCGPGGPPGARCGPPPSSQAAPLRTELVDASVHTVTSQTIDGAVVRAIGGRGAAGAFVTLETLADGQIAKRTPVTFDGVTDAGKLDVIQLMWRTDRHGELVFHLGADIGGWICHLGKGSTAAKCVIARGGGRPRS